MDNIHFEETLECVFLTPSTAPLFTPTCFPGLFSSKPPNPFWVHPTFCPAPKLPDYSSWPPTVPGSSSFSSLPRRHTPRYDAFVNGIECLQSIFISRALHYKGLWTRKKSGVMSFQTEKVKKKKRSTKHRSAQNKTNLTLTSRSAAGFVHSRMYAFNVFLLFGGGRERGGGAVVYNGRVNLPVGHIQGVKVAPWDEVSEERLGLATGRPVADDDPGAAEVQTQRSMNFIYTALYIKLFFFEY